MSAVSQQAVIAGAIGARLAVAGGSPERFILYVIIRFNPSGLDAACLALDLKHWHLASFNAEPKTDMLENFRCFGKPRRSLPSSRVVIAWQHG
jgi:hypothetical protein